MKHTTGAVLLGALALAPIPALADDVALIVAGSDYRYLPDLDGAAEAATLAEALEAEGFAIVSALDRDAAGAAEALERFRAEAQEAERVFVFVTGHILSTTRESWFLTRYAEDPTDFTIGTGAVPLGPVLDIAAAHPGRAVVMLSPAGEEDPGGPGLLPELVLEAPEGVALFEGPAADLVSTATGTLLVPGRVLRALPDSIAATGDLPDTIPFTPLPSAPGVDREAAFWDVVKTMGTAEAFQTYLDTYPNGRFAALARAAIGALRDDASTRAEDGEAALALSREQRRDIQRDLSLLGYDPRGIDGIFGPGSRAAITAWQTASGYPATGYITADQRRVLADRAAVRAAELEREAAARKAEEERQDTAYWRETGRGGDEAGLRAYLARYPDGLFSDVAETRLAEIEEARRAAAAEEERAYWDQVRREDNAAAYRRYLDRYPRGAFSEEARARLDALTAEAGNAAAKAEEERVAGNGVTRLLVENRLKAAGYDPGPTDGTFNKKTRRAIRQFQRAAGIEVSGYVTQATMVRLLAVR
ncbi:peptidoglycan-binding domain-containing protein [Sinisalibacter aestuarii]|uniref:Peptidoglycan-binding protein n=1 Tax=Sinisalibacter aestuarii TaxID=2949426 RepID=A0ABQ5LPX7_9RHOB|nr:peptidoglycan-binding domain-containing protein [Sinisalibacter aestuarii]GKY86803.1 peptidoglycan-binding protein [Sinisalibacter aestuarii]